MDDLTVLPTVIFANEVEGDVKEEMKNGRQKDRGESQEDHKMLLPEDL